MGEETPRPCAVCTDAAAAHRLWVGGLALVLFGPDAAALGRQAAGLRAAGPGRVAVFVGDPAIEADRAAALAMAQEQFGATPVLVSSPAQARALMAAGYGTGS